MCRKSPAVQKHSKCALPSSMKKCRREWSYWYLEEKGHIFKNTQLTSVAIIVSVREWGILGGRIHKYPTADTYQIDERMPNCKAVVVPLLFRMQKWIYEFEMEISSFRKFIALKKKKSRALNTPVWCQLTENLYRNLKHPRLKLLTWSNSREFRKKLCMPDYMFLQWTELGLELQPMCFCTFL